MPAAAARAVPSSARSSARPPAAPGADDPVPGNEGVPDNGFDNEPEGEQDDFAGTGMACGSSACARSWTSTRTTTPTGHLVLHEHCNTNNGGTGPGRVGTVDDATRPPH
ncbi:hypothetical protein ACFVT1_05460 [Streptomyces sp. NPDC057963]|uniref:hypothetical protein n=1 Tax=Streptomyces sp. NPDC057963 TaxID=3346290 RepID=UPI0036ECE39C